MNQATARQADIQVISGRDPKAADRAAQALGAGHVVAIPTDTVYGLGAQVDQQRAIRRLFELKGRPAVKAIPVLLDRIANIGLVAPDLSPAETALMERFWPGPLTLVLPARPELPAELTSRSAEGAATVAVRVPDHELARAIIAAAGGALAVTSANRSGEPPALDAHSVQIALCGRLRFVVDGGRAPAGGPSTIVQLHGTHVAILREGAISRAAIEATLAAARSSLNESRPKSGEV